MPTAPGRATSPNETPTPAAAALTRPDTRWYLLALRAEIAAAQPDVPLPELGRVEAIGDAGTLSSPEAQALLAELELAASRAGVPWPP